MCNLTSLYLSSHLFTTTGAFEVMLCNAAAFEQVLLSFVDLENQMPLLILVLELLEIFYPIYDLISKCLWLL